MVMLAMELQGSSVLSIFFQDSTNFLYIFQNNNKNELQIHKKKVTYFFLEMKTLEF